MLQIVGVEGQNPSGHYLTASKLLDTVPLSRTADLDLPPAKKQNLDQEVLTLADESHEKSEVSFVSIRFFIWGASLFCYLAIYFRIHAVSVKLGW